MWQIDAKNANAENSKPNMAMPQTIFYSDITYKLEITM